MQKYTKTRPNKIYSNFFKQLIGLYKGVRAGGQRRIALQVLQFEKYQNFLAVTKQYLSKIKIC